MRTPMLAHGSSLGSAALRSQEDEGVVSAAVGVSAASPALPALPRFERCRGRASLPAGKTPARSKAPEELVTEVAVCTGAVDAEAPPQYLKRIRCASADWEPRCECEWEPRPLAVWSDGVANGS